MTESTDWYWKSHSVQHLHFPHCYYLNIGIGTHLRVVPSRQVVREKVVWGGLQRCWRVTCRMFPLHDEVPFFSRSFLLFSPHTSEVSLGFFFFFSFLASLIYLAKWAEDNMKFRSLSLRRRPLSAPTLRSPLASHSHCCDEHCDPNSSTLTLLVESLPPSIRMMLKSIETDDQNQIL